MINPDLEKFPQEVALIGRILLAYSELEVELLHCVVTMSDDLDAATKALFRMRGESQRIEIADGLSRATYESWGHGTHFAMAVGAVKQCLQYRNQYAHCKWYGQNKSGMLAFVDLEEIAALNTKIIDFSKATKRHVTVSLLQEQLAYFEYAQEMMFFVRYALMVSMGKEKVSPFPKAPKQPKLPEKYIP